MPTRSRRCPCGSGRRLHRCCGPLHEGRPAPTAEALMRSRFAAYALGLVDYIIATTHPDGEAFEADEAAWRASIGAFCAATRFEGLVIEDAGDLPDGDAWVTFTARLTQKGHDASFTEKSRFRRHDGRWCYLQAM